MMTLTERSSVSAQQEEKLMEHMCVSQRPTAGGPATVTSQTHTHTHTLQIEVGFIAA